MRLTKEIYAIQDTVAKAFLIPMFVNNREQALREFETLQANPELPIHRYPDDFRLWFVGTYDLDTGHITADQPELVSVNSELREVANV